MPLFTKADKTILSRLWLQWVWPYKMRLLAVFLLMIAVALAGGAYPALISHVFDLLAGTESQQQSRWFALPDDPFIAVPLLVVSIAFIKAVAMFYQVLGVNSLALKITTDIQKAMAAHLIDGDLAAVTAEPAGAYISRIMNDLNLIREALVRLANNLVRDLLTIIVMVGVMFWFSWQLSVLVLAVYPLAMRPIIRIGNRQRQASGALQEHLEDVVSLLAETLQGIRMVKAYQLEETEKKRTRTAFDGLYGRLVSLLSGRARIDPVLEALGGLAVAGVIALAAWQVSAGQMQVGDVVGFITALLMLVQPVRALGTLNAVVQEGLAAGGRIFALLDRRNLVTAPAGAEALRIDKGHIRFDGVSFAYNDQPVLKNISFEVQPGETLALVGPSGSGKSSLLNLLPRFYDISAGRIFIDGTDISTVSLASLRAQMALVAQDAVLFDDTIAANIRFGRPDADEGAVKAAARAAAAEEFITALDNGFGSQVGVTGGHLSGGQKQRIAIARAMLRDAPVLLLDEATSALDAQAEEHVQKALETLSKGRTTLVIAHRLSAIRHADRILVLQNGEIVQSGTHDELIKAPGLYADLCALQSIRTGS